LNETGSYFFVAKKIGSYFFVAKKIGSYFFVAKKIEPYTTPFTQSPTQTQMSYTPGTKLSASNGNEMATVLTGGMVMASATDGSWRWRQMMSLEDWLLMVGSAIATPAQQSSPAPAAAAEPAQQEEPVPLPKRPIGTKLRWVLSEETYRIAIATGDGILQVKSVSDGAGDCVPRPADAYSWQRAKLKKTMYPTEEEWRSSLPQGGEVTIVEPPPKNAPVIVKGASDAEKVEQLSIRFKVRAGVYEQMSHLARREMLLRSINDCTRIIASYEAQPERSEFTERMCYSYKKAIAGYKRNIEQIDVLSEAEKTRRSFCVSKYSQSKQKLFVTLANGISTQISPSSRIDIQRGNPAFPSSIFCHYDRKLYSSLQEMNIFKGANGLPVIQASYRRKMIDLSHLFTPEVVSSSMAYDSGC
jgi:hypothetical protein